MILEFKNVVNIEIIRFYIMQFVFVLDTLYSLYNLSNINFLAIDMSVTDLYYLDADMQVVLEQGISNSEDQYPTFSFKKNHQIHTNITP